jgi:hypothetical protein
MRLYLDASAIIYSVEGLPGFQAGVADWVQVEAAAGLLITSRLSLLECCGDRCARQTRPPSRATRTSSPAPTS